MAREPGSEGRLRAWTWQIVEAQGLETIIGSLKFHPYDTVLLSNGFLALASICSLPLSSLELGKSIATQAGEGDGGLPLTLAGHRRCTGHPAQG
eukprot:759816-Hanusia_phi.AAC.2